MGNAISTLYNIWKYDIADGKGKLLRDGLTSGFRMFETKYLNEGEENSNSDKKAEVEHWKK